MVAAGDDCETPTPSYWPQGGNVLRKPVIVPVCWGNNVPHCGGTSGRELVEFYKAIGPGSAAGFQSLNEYSLGGAIAEPTVLSPMGQPTSTNGAWVLTPCNGEVPTDEASIRRALRNHLPTGGCPDLPGLSETEDRIYIVHFNEVDSVGLTENEKPYCDEWCAYHSFAQAPLVTTCGNGPSLNNFYPFQFGVIPIPSECYGCRKLKTDFDAATRSASHELMDTITEPIVSFTASSCSQNSLPTFVDDICNHEIADGVCERKDQDIVGLDGNTYLIQKHWSNQACDCVVSVPPPLEVGPLFPTGAPLTMLSYLADDQSLGFVASSDTRNFTRERSAGCKQFRSSHGPALVTLGGAPAGNSVALVWKGEGSDTTVWFSALVGTHWWMTQVPVPASTIPATSLASGATTDSSPAATFYNGEVWIAAKGAGNNGIWLAHVPPNGTAWTGEYPGLGFTDVSPALTVWNGNLVVAWRELNTHRIKLASLVGNAWTPVVTVDDGIGGVATTDRKPALAAMPVAMGPSPGVAIALRVEGITTPAGSVWNGVSFLTPAPDGQAGTTAGPALVTWPGGGPFYPGPKLLRYWKGSGDDWIWTAGSDDGVTWDVQQTTHQWNAPNYETADSPAAAVVVF